MKARGRGSARTSVRQVRPVARPRTPSRTSRVVIAIDGPAGAGKSTAARALAARLGYTYVDSGAMYRAVALAARERGIAAEDAAALGALARDLDFAFRDDPAGPRVLLDGRDVTIAIRAPEVAEWASRVALVPAVRARLVERQRALAAGGGVVMDGRDIGTVALPDAACKFFVTASPAERARRRLRELEGAGAAADLAATRAALVIRDRRDRGRAIAPLEPAADAVVIDTTTLTPARVVARMLRTLRARKHLIFQEQGGKE